MKITICPSCRKEIPKDAKFCDHCANPVVSVIHKTIFSWQWSDRIFLLAVLLVFIAFFQPWFPGSILYRKTPISAYQMLLNVSDLEVDFLQSYNILRMTLIVPIFASLIYFLTYFRRSMQKSIFLPLFLFVVVSVAIIPFLFETAGTVFGIILTLMLLLGIFFYFRSAFRRGRLGLVSYCLLLLFMCLSVFIYQLDLTRLFYLKLENLNFSETYGFWITWFIFALATLSISFNFMKTIEDFWLMVFGVILSIIGYNTFIDPLFLSGPFAFFADNFRLTGIHTLTHIKVVSIALIIAIATGVPIGVYISRHPTAASIVLYLSSIMITIPSIALFGFMMPILSSIDKAWDAVSGIGIGTVPAVIALALYSQLPIIRNTYIAIKNVDPATIEAGRGMGMTHFQLLIQLQLPLAAPVIMAGVRTAVVMSIAIAAIAAYIGAGGLGLFVSEGLQMATNDSVILGAVAMGLLAIAADILFEKLEDWITPTGLKIAR
ncbi:MAG: ABC transporter permease subunit [Syntrophobacterales bacterium]|jgi:osmoprotectant transport system permease protein